MNYLKKLIIFCLFLCVTKLCAEENFLLIEGSNQESLYEFGSQLDERVTPCSTFKIALSLMGFDAGILIDKKHPAWSIQKIKHPLRMCWRIPQTPQSWIKSSCVWYSQRLITKLGIDRFQSYLSALDYGNQDTSGGLTKAWLSSSLKISPREQVLFIQKMLTKQHPIFADAMQMTKDLLFIEQLSNGWKLFGKTGLGKIDSQLSIGWFVGFIQKEDQFFTFAYNEIGTHINRFKRIARVKELLVESNVYAQASEEAI